MNNVTYITTKHLDAMIFKDGGMKLAIFKAYHSPYGWDKRELIVSHYGVEDNEFTYDYVSNKVDEVYSTFPNEEIHELITKVKKYKNG
jgi:hypothetical protein